MRKDAPVGSKDSVSAAEVEARASEILVWALQLKDHGYRCTVATMLRVLFFAAARITSLHDACRRLTRAPSDQALRNAWADWMPSMPTLEERLNQALAAAVPRKLFKKAQAVALDFKQIPYYGQPFQAQREVCRGKRQAGTSRFHCYATLYLLSHGQRYTLALTYVWKDDTSAQVVARLLSRGKALGLKVRYLLLDRGFYSLPVVTYLQSIRCPFLMPVVHRGRRSSKPLDQLQGTRRFLAWKHSGFAEHVMRNRQTQASVRIAVTFRRRRRRGQHGRRRRFQERGRPLVFAFWGFTPPAPAWVRDTYRGRFGIESSYRQLNQGRVRTCSRDPRLRLLLVGIALVLRNVWVGLHHTVLGRVCGRGIHLRLERLRLRTLLLMLQRCAEAVLGCQEQLLLPPTLGP